MHIATPLYTNRQCKTAHTFNNNPAPCSSGGSGTTCNWAELLGERLARFITTALIISSGQIGSASILELESLYVAQVHAVTGQE